MAVAKMSISVPLDVKDVIEQGARDQQTTVSAWLAQAALEKSRRAARLAEGLIAADELIAEAEREDGPIADASWQRADDFIAELRREQG